MAQSDPAYLRTLGPERVAVSFRLGENLGPARGVVIKFVFFDGRSETVLVPPGWVEAIRSMCDRFLADFRRESPTNERVEQMFNEREPDLTQDDFDRLTEDDVVGDFGAMIATNGLGFDLGFRNGERRGVNMPPMVVFRLQDALERTVPFARPTRTFDMPG